MNEDLKKIINLNDQLSVELSKSLHAVIKSMQGSKFQSTSKALISACGKIRFNINQPSSSNSQIQDFLDRHQGAGIQHIALQTNQIFRTIDQMRQQQLAFLAIDPTYYIARARLARGLSGRD